VLCGTLSIPVSSNYKEIEYILRDDTVVGIYKCAPSLTIRGNNEKTCNRAGNWVGFILPCSKFLNYDTYNIKVAKQ